MGTVQQRKNTLPVGWEKTMADDAKKGRAKVASVGVSTRIKTRGGILSFMDSPMPGNKMQAVILASSWENGFYEGEFDPDNPKSPVCYAFGDEEETLSPHKDSPKPQNDDCASCKHNKWGSAEKGRGKACKNQVHLSLIHADSLKSAGKGGLGNSPVATANVPPTSLPSWATYVRKLEESTGKPPYSYVTDIALVPDAKSQFKWTFEPAKAVDKAVLGHVFVAAKSAEKEHAERPPYPKDEEKAGGRGAPARKAGKPKFRR